MALLYEFIKVCVFIAYFTSGAWIGTNSVGLGRSRHHSLGVVNGTVVPISEFPYMASFKLTNILFGSGVIIDKRWILTTAFNVYGWDLKYLEFRVGSNKFSSGGKVVKIEKVVVHEGYGPWSWDNDIALVKVEPLKFGKRVNSIALGTQSLKQGTKVVVAGWGEKNRTQLTSEVLLVANVTVSDQKNCTKTYNTPNTMCTFDKNVGPCVADFGDPLILNKTVYGMFIGGYSCQPGNDPPLYVEVAGFHDWIIKIISNN